MDAVGEKRSGVASSKESELVARLRAGDEDAFRSLIETHNPTMLAVARTYVNTRASAEEVTQEAWLGVIKGLDRFEGRSSLRTWILRILVNTAMGRGVREARSTPFSSIGGEEGEPAVQPERFRRPGEPFPGHWMAYPSDWSSLPEERLMGRETLALIRDRIEQLPDAQRTVITLRDITGCSSEEVCDLLEISPENQRVLLHRARSKVRAAIERHLDG